MKPQDPQLNLFKSRADVRLRASLQKTKLEVLPAPTDAEVWRDLQRHIKESKDPKDVEYWTNRLDHELFYRSQWRAINMEERRREAFRKLVDKTEGDCAEAYDAELEHARDLINELLDRLQIEGDGHSAGKRILVKNRVQRAQDWVKELKEMGK